jgi:copper transport protein
VFKRRVAIVAAWLVVVGLTFVGPMALAVRGHSQLVTSEPGAGEVVPTSPSQLRLVFSEPIDAAYTKLDLLDANGKTLASGIGAPDPSDPYSLVAPVGTLPDGVYSVVWRALSAADGHTTSGFFTFGVGNVTPPPPGTNSAGAGSIHAGHDATTAFLETESRVIGDLGLLLAFGLPIIAWVVLRGRPSTGLIRVLSVALLLAVAGAVGLIWLGGNGIGADPITFVAESRPGQLLAVRAAIGLIAIGIVLALMHRRPSVAVLVAGLAGAAGLVLLAAGGHAAAYASPAPVTAIVVHLGAGGVWLSGLLTVAWLAISHASTDRPLSLLVPRFSALALVSVGLVGLTGIYSDWIQTRALISLDTDYGVTLAIKMGLALCAFGLGAFNYVSGGRDADRRFRPRVAIEACLALGVVVATGVLASGSPPAQELPIAIEPVASSVAPGTSPPTLELAPGRPGPTQFTVTVPSVAQGTTVELQLQRLDAAGTSTVTLRPAAMPGTFQASGGLLPANSSWDSSVVLHDSNGSEVGRTRYAFALDATGISEGRATPPIDPAIVIAMVLLLGAVVAVAFAAGGGNLPRVDRAAGRVALIGGSVVSAFLGAIILFGGPRL